MSKEAEGREGKTESERGGAVRIGRDRKKRKDYESREGYGQKGRPFGVMAGTKVAFRDTFPIGEN